MTPSSWQLVPSHWFHTLILVSRRQTGHFHILHLFPCTSLFFIPLIGTIGIGLVARPQSEVITEKLHDEGRVLVGFFVEGIELGNSVVEGLLGDRAGLVGSIEDLVVEDGEVEGKTKTDRVRRRKVGLGDSTGGLVSIQSGSSGFLSCVSGLEFGEVSVVVTLHLVVENLGFLGGGVRDKGFFDDAEDIVTDFDEFGFDLGLVVLDDFHLAAIALLFDAGNDAPRCSSGSDNVLVSNAQQVAFFDGKFLGLLGNFLPILRCWK